MRILQRYPSPNTANWLGKVLNGVSGPAREGVARYIDKIDPAKMIDLARDFGQADDHQARGAIAAYAFGAYKIMPSYRGFVFQGVPQFANDFEGLVVGSFGKIPGSTLLGLGDPAVRNVLGMSGGRAIDVLGITDEGKFILADAKGAKGGVLYANDFRDALEQIESTIAGLKNRVMDPEFELIQIGIPDLSKLAWAPGNYKIEATFTDPNTGKVFQNVLLDPEGKAVELGGTFITLREVLLP